MIRAAGRRVGGSAYHVLGQLLLACWLLAEEERL